MNLADPSPFDGLAIALTPLAVLVLATAVFVYALWSEARRDGAPPPREAEGFGRRRRRHGHELRHGILRRRERLVPQRPAPDDQKPSSRKETA